MAVRRRGRDRRAVDSTLRGRADVRRPARTGTWIGVQNAIGNMSGIIGPVITGMIIDAAGYGRLHRDRRRSRALGGFGGLVGVPKIGQVDAGRGTIRPELSSFRPLYPQFFLVALTFSLGLRIAMMHKIHREGFNALARA